MFQFTTTTILNTNIDSSGTAKWSAKAGEFFVRRVNNFLTPNVASLDRRYASNPVFSTSQLQLDPFPAGQYQLAVYVKYQGSQNSFYANPVSYIKGKPLFYAFTLDDVTSGLDTAKAIVKIAKWLDTRFDNKWLDITNSSNTLKIDAIDEYQRFGKVVIEKFDTDQYGNAIWKTIVDAKIAGDPGYDAKYTIVQGREGFGTYTQLLKDLRLPTATNTNWLALNQEERPIPGELYNEYVLQYVKNRGIMGQSAVGSLAVSSTTHVFYVRQSLAVEWEGALKSAGIKIDPVEGPGKDLSAYPLPTPPIPTPPPGI